MGLLVVQAQERFSLSDVTQILSQIESGDAQAAEQLLPPVYDDLRKLAAAKLAQETPGQTLQATALVHETYRRLVGGDGEQSWDSRGHFFAAAAEAVRRILGQRLHKLRIGSTRMWGTAVASSHDGRKIAAGNQEGVCVKVRQPPHRCGCGVGSQVAYWRAKDGGRKSE